MFILLKTPSKKEKLIMARFLICFLTILGFLTPILNCQQKYSENSVMDCNNTDETGPSPAFLYSCNGEKQFCRAFLIFQSQLLYNSVTTISDLTSSDPSELARINNIANLALFPTNQEVIVPVNCSCSGQYYQAHASYIIKNIYETYFTIANDTYEGLSTCDSLLRENIYGEFDLLPNLKLQVPLRCACPTSNQAMNGTNFLLTYLVTWGDSVPKISERFNVTARSVAYANGFSEEDPTLYPFTTILIPLQTEPLSSQTIIRYPPIVSPPFSPSTRKGKSRKGLYIGIGIGFPLLCLCLVLFMVFSQQKRDKIDVSKQKSVLPNDLLVGIADADDQVLKVYEFEEIEAATKNFSPKNRLSDSVYRGVLRGKSVAIKKRVTDVSKEVNILQKVNHFNLISLYGASHKNGIFYLIYEFMENGCLKDWLRREDSLEGHSWNFRIRIALDVANGLHYLHNFTDPALVHKDISSSNILLNTDLRAKIANFSFARLAEKGVYGNSPTRCAAKGYMAPEYIEFGTVTPKIDTYAFGVILLELIKGKEAVFEQDGEEALLSEAVFTVMDGEKTEETELGDHLDPRLQVNHRLGFIVDRSELAHQMVKLSLACLKREPESRLSMGEVVSSLTKIQLDVQKSESLYMV